MAELPRVGLILTGGTIDWWGRTGWIWPGTSKRTNGLDRGELLAQLPELKGIAQVEEIAFRRLASHAFVDKDWLDLANRIETIFAEIKPTASWSRTAPTHWKKPRSSST